MSDKNPQEYCDDELLSAYVDGELTDAERASVDRRLRDDPQAREMVAELGAVSQTLRSLPKHELGADLREAVLQQAVVRAEQSPAEIGGPRRWAWAALALAATLMLVVYLPEANRDDQHLAKAPLKERAVEPLQVSAKQETSDLGLLAESSASSLSGSAGVLEGNVDFRDEAERTAGTDTVAMGTAFDGTLRSATIESPFLQPISEVQIEDYHIHLTPVDRSVGAARFEQLLANHGISVRGRSSASSDAEEPTTDETELVLVEAPLEQIQQIVASCGGDDSPWKSLRLVDQDGVDSSQQHFARQKSKLDTPVEEDAAVVLNVLQLSDAPARGWAVHLGRGQVPSRDSSLEETASSRGRSVATLRVLFILHSAE